MGGEFAQRSEWTHEGQLDWAALESHENRGVQHLVGELNRLYRTEAALHELDFSSDGFQWLEPNDHEQSVLAFLRRSRAGDALLVVSNMTPVPRQNYCVGVPHGGTWHELLNSDASTFGGSGWGNLGAVEAAPMRSHGQRHSVCLTLPPLSTLFLKAGDA
jgi:1,4-alpha-glucan branching enzyme